MSRHIPNSFSDDQKKRNELCEDLLNVISKSVQTFKPSRSLANLELLEDAPQPPSVEIDIVISGGGLKGYFMTGCSHILLHELRKQNVGIARIAGASAGAWCGLFMLTGFSTENWLETYYLCKERPGMTMHEAYDDIWPWLSSQLPDDAWKICTGRLFISVTEVTMFGFKNHMISEYSSNRDIIDACLASSTVPFISLPTMFRWFRGMCVLDGGITNNTPVFADTLRRQLVFRLSDVFYPTKFLINPGDLCIESLVVRGAILMSRFLQGESSDAFAWLRPSSLDDDRKALTATTPTRLCSWTSAAAGSLLLCMGIAVCAMVSREKAMREGVHVAIGVWHSATALLLKPKAC